MAIDTFLKENAAFVRDHLQNFIANYHLLPDDKRMIQSDEIFQHLRNFFQAHHVLADSALKRDVSLENALALYQAEEDELWDVYEHTINIHVDEPYSEYKIQLERLLQHFQTFATLEYDRLLARMTSQLDDTEKEGLERKVKKDPEMLVARM